MDENRVGGSRWGAAAALLFQTARRLSTGRNRPRRFPPEEARTQNRAADFQVCRVAGFQTCWAAGNRRPRGSPRATARFTRRAVGRPADLEVGDTADLEVNGCQPKQDAPSAPQNSPPLSSLRAKIIPTIFRPSRSFEKKYFFTAPSPRPRQGPQTPPAGVQNRV
jgi:hypothetical protein